MKRLNLINFSLLALALTACQDEDLGFTKSEVYQSYIDRKYAEEFAKAFPDVDPNHTWMCTPDTFYNEVEVPGLTRAAGDPPQAIVRTQENNKNAYTTMTSNQVKAALNYMFEGADNKKAGKASLDYEFKAVENTDGEGYEVYTITPTFWGRKFVNTNAVGIYYLNANDEKVDMDPFWNDNTDSRDLYVNYSDGCRELVPVSAQQITDDPNWANSTHNTQTEPDGGWELTHPCDYCGNVFMVKDNGKGDIHEPVFATKGSFKCIEVKKPSGLPGTNNIHKYDTQLFITTGKEWAENETFTLTFDYWVERSNNPNNESFDPSQRDFSLQLQEQPGQYVSDISTTEKFKNPGQWNTMTIKGTIKKGDGNSAKKVQTIALDLHIHQVAVNFYFKNIRWYSGQSGDHNCGRSNCNKGKVAVSNYELPQYTLKVPVGTVWGVYLETRKQQTGDNSQNNTIRYYSNSDYNKLTENNNNTGLKAAATFSYPDEKTTYISFEDAPTNCSEGGNGNCSTCGRGHWDKDYNDIVLTVSPRPVTRTYRSISYRVMCEDLGGTFDWDFNDVVYDVIYADGKEANDKATIKYILKAIGGTLPIRIYKGSTAFSFNGKTELHEMMTGQTGNDGLYTPVNVNPPYQDYVTVKHDSIIMHTLTLEQHSYDADSGFDVRDYVNDIVIKAEQKNGTTSQVVFPIKMEFDESGQHIRTDNAVPQCFMTHTTTPWADELQPIYEKYPKFKSWVASFDSAPNWWKAETY